MGVTLGHLRIFMPEERPDGLQGHTAHSQVTGKGMPQVVEPKLVDACPFQRAVERAVDPQDARTVRMAEQVRRGDVAREPAQLFIEYIFNRYGFALGALRNSYGRS